MATDLMNYDELMQDSLRSLVRGILKKTAAEGLPGAHHFYVTFKTAFPGVVIPESLREKHPLDMTIVLQHQYWDLKVGESTFSVTLSFFDRHETITVPFEALINFMDPSVKFGLQFTPPDRDEEPQPLMDEKDNVVTLDIFRKNKKD